jgi:hypothetical protein
MDIGGTSLFNSYSGGYLTPTQSRTVRDSKSPGPEPGDRVAEKDNPETPGTRFSSKQLSEEEQRKVQELKQQDREVRAHEAAHLAAAGRYATGGASFEYERGPDGKSYAVGGEVGIDTSPVPDDPQATLQKARVIKAAALAPADPSTTDRKVAADAARMEAEARQEISRQRMAEKAAHGATGNEPTVVKRHKQNVDSADNRHTAASAYRIVDDLTRSAVSGVSPIDLTA